MADHQFLLELWSLSEEFRRLERAAEGGEGPCSVFGVPEEPAAFLTAALARKRSALVVTDSEQAARRISEALEILLGHRVVQLPPREIQLRSFAASSRELAAARVATLGKLCRGEADVCVVSAEAFGQPAAPPEVFLCAQMTLTVGETIPLHELPARLSAAGYERVDKVDAPGQFRQSGSLLDIYSYGDRDPVRAEFFDDEVDSLRSYDPMTQRSLEKLEQAVISPATEVPVTAEAMERAQAALRTMRRRRSLLSRIEEVSGALAAGTTQQAEQLLPLFYEASTLRDYLPQDALTILIEPNRIEETYKEQHARFLEELTQQLEAGEALPIQAGLMLEPARLWQRLETSRTVCIGAFARAFHAMKMRGLYRLEVRAASRYGAAIPALAQDLEEFRQRGVTVLLYAGARAEKLRGDLTDQDCVLPLLGELNREPLPGERIILAQGLINGFEWPEQKLAVFAEADLYGGRKAAVHTVRKRSVTKMDIFADLKIGDFVVHETYGIGVFQGIQKLTADGKSRDFMQIQYSGADKLYVPTDQLDRVQKYIGGGEKEKAPKLSKLGGQDWNRQVSRVRQSVKALAFDLVKLYADRKARPGYAFSPDSPWQRQLETDFPYEETPDQITSIAQIKADMEAPVPMDRLLCGDVGYGKTEVAVRAAFKAVQDSKQVAFLVPTTVLAQQHYQTLLSRFEGYPVTVELLSRFRTAKQQRETIERLRDGRTDIVVGTHRILAKDVKFHDLGLLIVDEEQRFGVGHKEQIKEMKRDVDVLTLSATPIPRTLHMSMMGIRDMSVIETPPEERFPVQTYVMEYSPSLVRDAIYKEVNRGGQVYFLYNQVASMESFLAKLSELVPGVRIAMAHGQMPEGKLEKTMLAFMEGEFDVLLCSTIIESGLDIPNANTILVYDADKIGLSQLYQLRGRVGRSNRIAYAYFTFQRDKVLSEVAQKRLSAIREFTQFGSGFKIAMRDLEIRGAGNLIGAQQHGHMSEVGYDMYCKLVEEAVHEAQGKPQAVQVDTQMDIPIDAFIPADYITDQSQRLEIYKRIASIESRPGLYDVQEEIEDRFGDIPAPVQNLMEIALLKAYACRCGMTQVSVRPGEVRMKLHPHPPIDGGELVEVLGRYKGRAMMTAGEAPVILLRQKSLDIKGAMALCGEFLSGLCG